MKNQFWILLAAALFLVVGCEKDNMKYIGLDGVYFGVRAGGRINDKDGPFQPSSYVEFMKMERTEYTYNIPMLILGEVKSYDRKFRITVDKDSTSLEEGKHYKKLEDEYILPAGAIQTTIPVTFFTAEDLDYEEKRIVLQVVETSDFKPAFTAWDPPADIEGINPAKKFNASRHTIFLNNMMVMPAQWLGKVVENGLEFNSLGAFTRRKMEFITENLGVSYSEFSSPTTMSLLRMILIGQQLSKILIERFDAGDPVLEDDGRLMYAGGVPWQSFIGIPYKP